MLLQYNIKNPELQAIDLDYHMPHAVPRAAARVGAMMRVADSALALPLEKAYTGVLEYLYCSTTVL